MAIPKPERRPANACFSSGPCPKRPGWSTAALDGALVGRSHRSKAGKLRLKAAIDQTRALLGVPETYRIGIVPGSDTGAVELALWSMLGERGVDVLAWESFGQEWVTDVVKVLKLADTRVISADYGELPDLAEVDCDRDVVFVWNGTTSGVRVPDGEWIPDARAGLTICDATSAVYAMEIPWLKLDVVTFSWQKVLGGEAGHGMLVISPRAVQRLLGFEAPRPLPKVFRLLKKGVLDEGVFVGETINTPSMLCVEDYLDAMRWAESVGGLPGLCERSRRNLAAIADWVAHADWIDFLAARESIRSCTSICLKLSARWITALDAEAQAKVPKRISGLLEDEHVAYDINGYRNAPPGLRIWGGATVDVEDIEALLPWLEWAYGTVAAEHGVAV